SKSQRLTSRVRVADRMRVADRAFRFTDAQTKPHRYMLAPVLSHGIGGGSSRQMGLAEFPGFDEAMRVRLVSAVDRLNDEFEAVYDRAAIRVVVDESARDLSAHGITPFVHILAERFARERLRAQAQAEGRLAKPVPEVLFVSLTGGGRAEMGAA